MNTNMSTINPTSSSSSSSRININNDTNKNCTNANHSTGEDEHFWFLSVCCPNDTTSNTISSSPFRSAFSSYQPRSRVANSTQAEQMAITLGSVSFDDDNYGYDDRDDVDSCDALPLIERTFSFDDGNDEDDYPHAPRSPHFFRFDDWSSTSPRDDNESNDESVYTSSLNSPANECFQEDVEVLYRPECLLDDVFSEIHTYYPIHLRNSSSTRALPPSNSSFTFQPIRDGSFLNLSVDTTSAAPTASLFGSEDPFGSGSQPQYGVDDGIRILECPSIARVGSWDDEQEGTYEHLISSVHGEDQGSNEDEEDDEVSSLTNGYVTPIPRVIFVRKERRGWKTMVLKSCHRIMSIGRQSNNDVTRKTRWSMRRSLKGRLGEF